MDMSNRPDSQHRPAASGTRGGGMPEIRIAAIAEALWRQKGLILAVGLLAALLASIPALMLPRSYTSTTQLLIDPRGLRVMEKDITPQAREPDLSVSIIESEMRFLASDRVLQRVVEALQLATRPGIGAAEGTERPAASGGLGAMLAPLRELQGSIKAMLGRSDPAAMSPQQVAMQSLQKAIRVSRHPNTYVIDLAVTGKDRELAAEVANAMAGEYIKARFDSRSETSRRASESINGRLQELGRQLREADATVERFKASNGLVSASGRLLTEQRMGELNTQLQVARAETVRAVSRMEQVRALRGAGGAADSSIEGLQSATLERMRTNHAAVRQREAALSATLLPSHPLYRQVRQESEAAQRSVDQELARIAESANAVLTRARATEQALDSQFREMKEQATREGSASIELRELERVAESHRNVYQSFLTRARELDEQQRIDPNTAVVLAAAEPARSANGPGLMPLLAAAGVAGLGLGAAFALRRDSLDPQVRSPLQLEQLAGADNLHRVPLQLRRRLGRILVPAGSGPDRSRYFVAPVGTPTAEAAARLHRALAGNGQRQGPRLCVLVAAEPSEAKSIVALNLAFAAARAGESVLLVDADREQRLATLDAGAGQLPGLAEVVEGTSPCVAVLIEHAEPLVHILPSGNLAELRPSRAKLDRLGETLMTPISGYDFVVVDGGVAGRDRLTQALAGRADACVLVVEQGGAEKAAVEEAAGWIESTTSGEAHLVLVTPR